MNPTTVIRWFAIALIVGSGCYLTTLAAWQYVQPMIEGNANQ